jgi:hypothetical protein
MKTPNYIAMLFALVLFSVSAEAQTTVSENELKTNINPLTSSLNYVNRLQPISFQYNTQSVKGVKLPGGTQYGFNTANIQSVLPAVVRTESVMYPAGKNQYRSVDITKVDMQSLVPVLLGAIQEQQQQIEMLKAEVQSLKQNRGTNTSAALRQ